MFNFNDKQSFSQKINQIYEKNNLYKMILNFFETSLNIQNCGAIPPMLKYWIVHYFLNSPLILIKFVSKFVVCKVVYFEAQCALRLRSPLTFMAIKIMLKTIKILWSVFMKLVKAFYMYLTPGHRSTLSFELPWRWTRRMPNCGTMSGMP